MTREEAIEKLEVFAPMVVDDTREAVDMAIEALERIDSYEDSRHTALEQEYLKGYEQGKKFLKIEQIASKKLKAIKALLED